MLISSESLWANLGSSSFFTAIVPIVLGGVLAYFKPWLPAEDDIRERSNLKRQVLLEEVNKRLQHLLSQLQDADFDLKDLRGAPPGQPDLIADFTAEFIQTIEVGEKLRKIYVCVKACYTLFLITVVAGLVGLLVAFVVEGARQYVSIACYIIIAFQLVLILVIRRWMGRFEECERIV